MRPEPGSVAEGNLAAADTRVVGGGPRERALVNHLARLRCHRDALAPAWGHRVPPRETAFVEAASRQASRGPLGFFSRGL